MTNKILGIPIFAATMWITFQLTFTLGGWLAGYIDTFIGWLGKSISLWILSSGGPEWLSSFISDGFIGGVGTVLIFYQI